MKSASVAGWIITGIALSFPLFGCSSTPVADRPAPSRMPASQLPTPAPIPAPYSCVTNYYVATNGNDSNSGTSAAPWRTLHHAVDQLYNVGTPKGGVCVNVGPGTYTEDRMYIAMQGSSDSPTGYLVFRSSTLHGATINMAADNLGADLVVIDWSKFVIFDGFVLAGLREPFKGGDGFFVMNSDHIKFLNNVSHDFGGSGIGAIWSDYLSIQGNVVYNDDCCDGSGTSGIDIWEPVAADSNPGFHIVISSNVSYDNAEGQDGRSPHSEGHGIMLDSFRFGHNGSGPYTPQTLVENNLVFGNGGLGINDYYSDNVTIRNNTIYHNSQDDGITYTRGEIGVYNSSHAVVVNNIAVQDPAKVSGSTYCLVDLTWDGTNIGNVWANNLTFDGTAGQAATSTNKTPITTANGNILGVNPLFVNPNGYVFTLQAGSPAIGAGTTAYGVPPVDIAGKPRSMPPDLGAYTH